MNNLFFYGTLQCVPLLERVLGRSADSIDLSPASLRGYVALSEPEGLYPVLRPRANADTTGIVVRDLSTEDIARLNYYEGGFDYDLRTVTLTSGETAEVYLPGQSVSSVDDTWHFLAWEKQWGAMTLWAAEEVMDGFGKLSTDEVARRFPRIRARAWSKVLAQSGRHGQGVLEGQTEIVERKRAHTNFFAMDEIALRHETFGGGMSDQIERAVFVSSDAAIVLPYDPALDRVLLVEQIRLGPIGRNDPVQWQMEPVAGLIDPGETAEEAARREGVEEAGLEFRLLEPAGECYASPGATTDFFHLFVGICDLPDGSAGIGGQEEEGENIRSHLMSYTDLLELADDGLLANAPLALLAYWLARHRARLRAAV
ncbi:tellurite resistance protein [Tateyamaria omphalii]|uniref:NUDIX domain-containing protein n=1 Tax=Tateyamaria omphalii TaxID=299262 RepID=UPI001677B8F3|nr:NUDIX domain-containing protein [Tateyamaria omphalii]GGX45619.1 tellurite resistance protein [Tateyamaria omphalii]